MEIKILKEKAIDIIEEYINEMIAEAAWSGHAYATEYLRDIQTRTIALLMEILDTNWGNERKYDIERVIREIKPDFDSYISELYGAGIPHREQIADIINDSFEKALGYAVGWVKDFVKDSVMEEMSSMEFDEYNMKYIGEKYRTTATYNGERYAISLTPYDRELAGGDLRKAVVIKVLSMIDPRYEQYIFTKEE